MTSLDAEQLHISITGETSVVVSWVSPAGQVAELLIQKADGLASPSHFVGQTIRPNSSRYSIACGPKYLQAPRQCRFSEVYTSPLLLHAGVEVQPATEYVYRLIDHNNTFNGPVFWRRFRTPPPPGTRKLRLAFVGDLGQTQFSAQTCRDLARSHENDALDLAVLVGDLAYADTDARRWDSFGRLFDSAGCSQVPWLVLPGNHEVEPDELTGETFIPYRFRWKTPEAAPERVGSTTQSRAWFRSNPSTFYDYGGSFYSIRLGNAHIISINPYTTSEESSPQLQWLRRELEGIDRSVTPYVIVLTHAPWRHTSLIHQPHDEVGSRNLRKSAEDLLIKARVDMIFSGHVHAYERSHRINGIRHFVVGHAGNYEKLYDEWLPASDSPCTAFRAGDHYGWGILHLHEDGANWQARRSDIGTVIDSLELTAGPQGLRDTGSDDECRSADTREGLTVAIIAGLICLSLLTICIICLIIKWRRRKAAKLPVSVEERTNLKDTDIIGAPCPISPTPSEKPTSSEVAC